MGNLNSQKKSEKEKNESKNTKNTSKTPPQKNPSEPKPDNIWTKLNIITNINNILPHYCWVRACTVIEHIRHCWDGNHRIPRHHRRSHERRKPSKWKKYIQQTLPTK